MSTGPGREERVPWPTTNKRGCPVPWLALFESTLGILHIKCVTSACRSIASTSFAINSTRAADKSVGS